MAAPSARVAVLIPCFNDGHYLVGAVESVAEPEPVEIWIADDASTDPATLETLEQLEQGGVRVLRMPENGGPAPARNAAMAATGAPYVFPLDADDLAVPGALGRLADALDADPDAAVAYTDVEELTARGPLVRAAPPTLDPFRVAYVNEMPLGALYRKSVIESLGGWQDPDPGIYGYEDWDLWMTLAERGAKCIHVDDGLVAYRYRLDQSARMTGDTIQRHPRLYRALRGRHQRLFEEIRAHRAASPMGAGKKLLYPYVYGGRRRFAFERPIKRGLDTVGVWTRRR